MLCNCSQLMNFQETRTKALSQSLNVRDVEETLKGMIAACKKQNNELDQKMANISADEKNLDAKIEQRRKELERCHRAMLAAQVRVIERRPLSVEPPATHG